MPSMTIDEAYEILKVSKDNTEEEIKKAYRIAALRTHPDKNPNDPEAHKEFLRVSEAYKRITEPESFQDEDAGMSEEYMNEMFTSMFSDIFQQFGGRSGRGRNVHMQFSPELFMMMEMMINGGMGCDDDEDDEMYGDEEYEDDEMYDEGPFHEGGFHGFHGHPNMFFMNRAMDDDDDDDEAGLEFLEEIFMGLGGPGGGMYGNFLNPSKKNSTKKKSHIRQKSSSKKSTTDTAAENVNNSSNSKSNTKRRKPLRSSQNKSSIKKNESESEWETEEELSETERKTISPANNTSKKETYFNIGDRVIVNKK